MSTRDRIRAITCRPRGYSKLPFIEYVENLDANEFVDVHHSLHVRKQTNHYLLGLQKPTRSKIYSGTWFSSRLRQCDHESLDMTLQINHDLTAAKQFGLMLKQLLRK